MREIKEFEFEFEYGLGYGYEFGCGFDFGAPPINLSDPLSYARELIMLDKCLGDGRECRINLENNKPGSA